MRMPSRCFARIAVSASVLVCCLFETAAESTRKGAPAAAGTAKRLPVLPLGEDADWRNIRAGRVIPALTYADQPYIVKTGDGAWLSVVTTGPGREGTRGQIVATMRSTDHGRTWSQPVAVEPCDGPEASYAVLLKVPGERIYVFYNHNSDNIREIPADRDSGLPGNKCRRVDSQGYFVFKYSDDGGRTWSAQRYPVAVREMDIDRRNPSQGKIRYFWNVGKAFLHGGAAFVPLHKVGGIGEGFFTRTEGVLLKCANILTERDPAKLVWETLPDGDFGLRAPPGGGPIAEEQSCSVLGDGSFYCVCRTIDGYPASAYSRDGGHHWTTPQYQSYADGRRMKHPRAANFVWKCANGKYLYWFHNHGGRFIGQHPHRRSMSYEDRNPAWLCGGVEFDTPEGKVIRWSQPEIVLYDDDPYVRMSYPDLVEDKGEYFLSETQKHAAAVHPIAAELVEGLWGQFERPKVARRGLVLDLPTGSQPVPKSCAMPALPQFLQRDNARDDYGTKDLRRGFSIELWLRFDSLAAGQVLLDNRTAGGMGVCLQTTSRGTVEIVLNDGRSESRWDCDPDMLHSGKLQHVVAIVDGGPKIVTFLVDGRFCDGGDFRQFGWGRFNANFRGPAGADKLRIGPGLQGAIARLRVYGRAIRTSEAVGNYQSGPEAGSSPRSN